MPLPSGPWLAGAADAEHAEVAHQHVGAGADRGAVVVGLAAQLAGQVGVDAVAHPAVGEGAAVVEVLDARS